jgi:penicillin-binding protein 2
MKIQIVGGDDIVAPNKYASDAIIYEREIVPTRGEILDFNGNRIIGNASRTDIVLQKAFFPEDLQEGNRVLLEIYRALEKHSCKIEEELPITHDRPYVYTEEDVSEVIEKLNLNVYASAENCIDKLISDNKIADT